VRWARSLKSLSVRGEPQAAKAQGTKGSRMRSDLTRPRVLLDYSFHAISQATTAARPTLKL
jgi:hypothetical protein